MDNLLVYFTKVNSEMMLDAPPNLSTINSTYRISTLIVRCTSGKKAKSELIASQLPSNAVPINSPLAFITGEPELPPVISLSVKKAVCNSPSLSAY